MITLKQKYHTTETTCNCILSLHFASTWLHPWGFLWEGGVRIAHLFSFMCCVVFWCFVCLRIVSGLPGVAIFSGLPGVAIVSGLPGVAIVSGLPGVAIVSGLSGVAIVFGLPDVAIVSGLSIPDCLFCFLQRLFTNYTVSFTYCY
jgi:hypothetical protein